MPGSRGELGAGGFDSAGAYLWMRRWEFSGSGDNQDFEKLTFVEPLEEEPPYLAWN